MEKFSNYRDPFTGINPFIPLKYRRITFIVIIRAIIKLPIWILYCAGVPVIHWIIKINIQKFTKVSGKIFANCCTGFDKDVIKYVLGRNNVSFEKSIRKKINVIFPERAMTNNLGILNYNDVSNLENSSIDNYNITPDFCIGLKYSNECIYISSDPKIAGNLYFQKLKWLILFLGYENFVNLKISRGGSLEEVTGLPKLKIDYKMAAEFNKNKGF